MRQSISVILLSIMLISTTISRADEGMWVPMFIKQIYEQMKERGLELSPEQIYDINNSSLKDAIVRLNHGMCTAEMISSKGLMLTNHHCGFDAIQELSTTENNYVDDGFWAMSSEEELSAQGFSASFLVRMEDVTSKILKDAIGLVGKEREEWVEKVSNEIVKLAIEDNRYEAEVIPFYGGNEFYLMVYETFNDVRLVGAPPSSIGKFGGDTDNWMWPRHTGDFSIFRVYTAPDGSPADYAENNIPYVPKHHLPISLEGVKPNDFTMVFGFPGSTERYKSSWGIERDFQERNQAIITIREKKLTILKEAMDSDPEKRLQLISEYNQISNYHKYFIGQNKGIINNNVIDRKRNLEAEFSEWLNKDLKRKAKYGNVLETIASGNQAKTGFYNAWYYMNEAGFAPEIITYAISFLPVFIQLKQGVTDGLEFDDAKIRFIEASEDLEKFYDRTMDKKMFFEMLSLIQDNLPKQLQPSIFTTIQNDFSGDVKKFTEVCFNDKSSVLINPKALSKFSDKPRLKKLENDLIFKTMFSFYLHYFELKNIVESAEKSTEEGHRSFIAGLREMNKNKNYYPDANSTLRFTYGQVKAYEPRDAVFYDYFTTVKGIIEKEDSTNEEFIVPSKIKSLYKDQDFGEYAEDGKIHVGFISNNDITGGNSGSPVLNGKGELIGCAFDGNWEAMSGDIVFENEIQRTISVDIRYILFVIDKFAGAGYLLDEMTLVKQNVPESVEVD